MANGKNETQVKGNTGKRYEESVKKSIVSFIEKGGRGKISEVIRDKGISYIAIRSWLKKYGKNAPKTSQKAKVGRPTGSGTKETINDSKRGRKANPNMGMIRVMRKIQKNLEKLNNLTKEFGKMTGK